MRGGREAGGELGACRPRRRGPRSRCRRRAGGTRRGSCSRAISTQSSTSRGEHRVAESLGTVGIRPLADRQDARRPGGRAPAGRARPTLGSRRVVAPAPACGPDAPPRCGGCARGGAAAAADQAGAKLLDEALQAAGQLLGRAKRVAPRHLPELGQPGVRLHRQGEGRVLRQALRCSDISCGPVAQFRPIGSTPSGSRAVSAAPISLPSSSVPVVSTVDLAEGGDGAGPAAPSPAAPRRRAALICKGSWQVSMRTRVDADRRAGRRTWKVVGVSQRLVPRVTQAGQPRPGTDGAEHEARPAAVGEVVGRLRGPAGRRPGRAPLIRSAIPNSPRLARFAPNVFVSTASAPASSRRRGLRGPRPAGGR